MNHDGPAQTSGMASESTADAVVAALRFMRMLRYRKSYLASALAVAGLLGLFYFFTTTRIYQASASLLVTHSGSEMWNTSMSAGGARDALIPTYEKLFTSARVLDGAIQRLMKMPAAARIDLVDVPHDQWRETLRDSLSAGAHRRTNIIELQYRSKSPEAAEAVVNAVVSSYLDFMDQSHKDVSASVEQVLRKELNTKEDELIAKQRVLHELAAESGSLGLPEDGTIVHPIVQRVIRINENLIEIRRQRIELSASLASVRAAVRSGADLRQHLLTVEPSVGRELMMHELGLSPQFAEIAGEKEKQLIADRSKLAALSDHLGATHPQIVELRWRIENAERSLADYQTKINQRLSSIEADQLGPMLVGMISEKLAEVWENERMLVQQYKEGELEANQLNGKMVDLQLAKNEVKRLTNWHETLLSQIQNIDLRKDHGDLRVNIVSEAMASQFPVSPRLSFVGLVCLLGGLGVGCVSVYVVDLLDDRFRSPDEMKEQVGVPILAMVRKLAVDSEGGAAGLQVHTAPNSVESEAFRTLRTTLAFLDRDMHRVAVTSSEPGDGKTTLLANLGVSYAQAGKRTVLIDCDLRRPGLSKLFDVRRMNGLTEVLRSDGSIEQLCRERIQATGVEGLDIIPCGPKPADPTEALSSDRFMDVINWAETNYDQVLVDCPPVMAASDAAIVGRAIDGMILVVQPQKNHRRLVLRAAESLTSMGVDLVGIVANRVGEDKSQGYYGYGYGYGYGSGYGYGHDDEDDAISGEESGGVRRRAA